MKGSNIIEFPVESNDEIGQFSHTSRAVLKTSTVSWMYLPEDILISVFDLLSGRDLGNAAQVCCRWRILAETESLWKKKLMRNFSVNPNKKLHPGARSWKQEYERLSDRVPCVELDKIEEHTDEVLHVSFSNNGMMFCTCSKDAYVKVFNADWPFNTVFSSHLGASDSILHWKYTQLSQFSPCDTQLLVSGRCCGSEQGGEIVIYNIFAGKFTIQARVRIKPYDVMGTWVNETHILSARCHFLHSTMQCLSEIILNKSAQEIENLHQSTVTRSFLFRSGNFATVCYLQVANLAKPLRHFVKKSHSCDLKDLLHKIHYRYLTTTQEFRNNVVNIIEDDKKSQLCRNCSEKISSERGAKRFKLGSKIDLTEAQSCFSFCSKTKQREQEDLESDTDPNTLLKSCGILATDTDSITDTEYNSLRSISPSSTATDLKKQKLNSSTCCMVCGKPIISYYRSDSMTTSEIDSSSATSADEEGSQISVPDRYKLLICFTGKLVCAPHQIGIKLLEQEECNRVVERDIDPFLSGTEYSRPDEDRWDHKIELYGQAIGMTVSACNRYLYVNVRRWLDRYAEILPLEPPKVSKQVELLVYDLITMKQVATLTGANAMSDIFFIHLSSNDLYVASGSEDSQGYIWDRHYETRVALLPHDDVVNCVAVNPRDPSMAVSVSDDKTVKIWRSKAFSRLLKSARPKARIKFRTHISHATRSLYCSALH